MQVGWGSFYFAARMLVTTPCPREMVPGCSRINAATLGMIGV
jgi:hypothetical protein